MIDAVHYLLIAAVAFLLAGNVYLWRLSARYRRERDAARKWLEMRGVGPWLTEPSDPQIDEVTVGVEVNSDGEIIGHDTRREIRP